MGGLPPVFIEFLGRTTGVKGAIRGVEAELAGVDASGAGAFQRTGIMGKAALLGLGVAAGEVAKHTVEMAGDFQQQMTRVRTGAGEAAGNMKLVSDGVLSMAGRVGQSTEELTAGLYMTESASYHGADALKVLETAAEGAKVGNADLKTTTDAVTTAMNAYKSGADSVVPTMNALIATEAEGKTNLEDLAGSMSSILPTAAAAKVGLNEVLGAMATMTAQGTPARVAATYLRQTIGMLSNPSAKAAEEMKNLGLNAVQVGQELGNKGLAATLTTLTDAIEAHMGPAGTVVIQHLRGASKSATEFQRVLADLPPTQQTYIGALATMVGGTKSMMGALQLTGPHMADFEKNTAGVAEHVKAGGKEVEGWADVQKNFNQEMAEAKASAEALGIEIGQYLTPYVQAAVHVIGEATTWLTQHQTAAKAAAAVIGGVLVFALAAATAWLYEMAAAAAVNPVVWIVVGVMALIAALVLLAMHWDQVWSAIKTGTEATGHFIVGIWDDVRDGTVDAWHSITGTVTGAWSATAAWVASAWHTVADPIVGGWHWVAATTTAVWNSITAFFRTWWPLLLVIFLPAVAIVMAIWNHFHSEITGTAHAVWGAIAAFLLFIWGGIQTGAHVVWAAIELAVIAPTMATWHTVQSVWHTAAAWLSAAWTGTRAVAGAIWGAIRSAMVTPLISAEHSIAGGVSRIKATVSGGLHAAYTAVAHIGNDFVQVGVDIVHGIIRGVESAGGALKGELGNLAHDALSSAKHFLGINSPSKLFADEVGSGIVEGIALGVNDNAHLAHTAVTGVAAGTVDAFSAELEINSPSKKFASLGAYVIQGLVQGLTGSQSQVKTATTKIANSLYVDFGSHHKQLQAVVAKDNDLLRNLAANRDNVAARLKSAQSNLASLQKAWSDEKSGIASGIMQNASIITQSPDEGRAVNANDVLDQMRDRVQAAKAFAAELDELHKKGLRSDLIEQLANAGVDQAGATALALAAASKGQIAEMNRDQAGMQAQAGQTGKLVADAMYGAGIKSAQGLIRGLKSQEASIEAQMLRIALAMQKAIKKALGIHSPSQVFADLGQFIPQGLAVGIEAGTHHATAAVAAMASAVSAPGLGPGYGGITGGGQVVNQSVTVHVDGSVLTTGEQLVGVVQAGFARFGARNPTTYPAFSR
ncbi:phage tail tape measure protein, TP901 family, core region [Actinacidiphila alni]|uniref:Phage tail tape measure protein, TP901 family, core region n=1 Tax=Actinacidiphila alni TaxID=380248 RepID=A0A1I2G2M1_9ACTN|nr:phage tail tape measure protein [Actinacidiphila alni]SFF11379.1 phage tail tape measure protein, TP901 family, core region [Actinacidiphila alni]